MFVEAERQFQTNSEDPVDRRDDRREYAIPSARSRQQQHAVPAASPASLPASHNKLPITAYTREIMQLAHRHSILAVSIIKN